MEEQGIEAPEGDSANAPDADVDLPSCDSCRKRKLRCSRQWPACSHCRRLSSKCAYEYQRKKPGVKAGAIDALNQRVGALESVVYDGLRKDPPTPVSSAVEGVQGSHAESSNTDALKVLSQMVKTLSSLHSDLVSARRSAPCEAATPAITSSVLSQGNTRSKSPIQSRKRIRAHSDLIQYETERIVDVNETLDAKTLLSDVKFLDELLDAYFAHVHPWIPILHEIQFRKQIKDKTGFDEKSIIIHAILVAAFRFVDGRSGHLPDDRIQDFLDSRRDSVFLKAMSNLAVESLQALVIITFTDIGYGKTSKAWSTIGSLTRTVQYLRLSVEDTDRVEQSALLSKLPSLPPPRSWIEEEEQRRVFWNIFLLDRFCSITTGWNLSLTADDVCRRLPIDGGLWHRFQPAMTPYFGIWDHSAAKIGNTITFLPSKYDKPGQIDVSGVLDSDLATSPSSQGNHASTTKTPKIGAFAYYIESVESLCRIKTYFLQQKIDFTSTRDVSSWLTRFKELDLRLVHWKMFLPQKWKDPNVVPFPPIAPVMDPNMTLAHITHNTSSILLHQQIAYPHGELRHLRLPSSCSADTCYVAATETANITVKYLELAVVKRVISPHFAMCIFLSAKTLLVHSLYYKLALAQEFWTLVKSLETMSSSWNGLLAPTDTEEPPFAGLLAIQLRELYSDCQKDPTCSPSIFGESANSRTRSITGNSDADVAEYSMNQPSAGKRISSPPLDQPLAQSLRTQSHPSAFGQSTEHPSPRIPVSVIDSYYGPRLTSYTMQPNAQIANLSADDLNTISEGLLDERFLEMDRIIAYDDFMFGHPI